MMEMYLAGVSVRRIEDITEALWGAGVSAGTISNLNKKIYGDIEEWRNRPLEAEYPYIYMDGIWLKRSWGGTVENVSILVAVGVNKEGYREVLGAAEGSREDAESWKNFDNVQSFSHIFLRLARSSSPLPEIRPSWEAFAHPRSGCLLWFLVTKNSVHS